jgi:hypothetical protein
MIDGADLRPMDSQRSTEEKGYVGTTISRLLDVFLSAVSC